MGLKCSQKCDILVNYSKFKTGEKQVNSNQSLPGEAQPFNSFIERLQTIDDPRDNRGKRHILAFVLAGVILAIMAGSLRTSSIHRFIRNRIEWLRVLTGFFEAKPISRAQLPRILSIVDLEQLNEIVEIQLGAQPALGGGHIK